MTSFVLSVIGDDRAGLVEALSQVVADHGGNWEKSHMAQLGGKFAGLVLVNVAEGNGAAFLAALEPLEAMGLLDITVEVPAPGHPGLFVGTPVAFEIVGNDHPGIVHEVSRLLASLDVNIVELVTTTESAAMDGAVLFRAWAEVHLPKDLTPDELVAQLESLATDLMVDVEPGADRPDAR
jgi:glycine cleavage system regulatory protein